MTKARRAWLDANKARMSAYGKARWLKKQAELQSMTTRFCLSCSTEKPSADFYQSYKTQCRQCLKAKAEPHKQQKCAYVAQWKRQNPERVRQWFECNKEHRRAWGRQYYARTPEFRQRRAAYSADWVQRNMHRVRAYSAKREAQELQATPAWADHAAIVAIYFKSYRLTRETGIKHEVDHIVPLRSALVCGLHCAHNLQILTAVENRRKSNHLIHVNLPPPLDAGGTRQNISQQAEQDSRSD